MNSGPGLIRGPTGASMELTKRPHGTTDNYRLLFSFRFEVEKRNPQRAEQAREVFRQLSRAETPG